MKLFCVLTGIIWFGFFINSHQLTDQLFNEPIIGEWRAVYNPGYNSLTFSQNGMLVIDPRVDTIYRFKYTVTSNGYLLLKDANQNLSLSKIEKLSADSLVLQDLLEVKGRSAFYKYGQPGK